MAETTTVDPVTGDAYWTVERPRPLRGVTAYLIITAMWIRSAIVYRANFVLLVLTGILTTGLEFVGIAMMFLKVDRLGGYSLAEVAFLYGASGLSLGLCDLLLGSVERIGLRIRDGSLDSFLVRPVGMYAQVAGDRFALRRINRIIQTGAVLAWAVSAVHVHWTAGRILMLPVMVAAGTVIYGAVFTFGAAYQFWALDGSEAMNAFTYGGNFLTQFPPTIFSKEMVRGAVFVIPLAFVNWWPAQYVLDRADPLGMPSWTHFLSPAVAAAFAALAWAAWRLALRAYRSTGS